MGSQETGQPNEEQRIRGLLNSRKRVSADDFFREEGKEFDRYLSRRSRTSEASIAPLEHNEPNNILLIFPSSYHRELLQHMVNGLGSTEIKLEMGLSANEYRVMPREILSRNEVFFKNTLHEKGDERKSAKDPLRVALAEAVKSDAINPPSIQENVELTDDDKATIRLIQQGYTDSELIKKGGPDYGDKKLRLMALYGAKTMEQLVTICAVLIKEMDSRSIDHATSSDTTLLNRQTTKSEQEEVFQLDDEAKLVLKMTAQGKNTEIKKIRDKDKAYLAKAYSDINRWAMQENPNSPLLPIQNAIVAAIRMGVISIDLHPQLTLEFLRGYQAHLRALVEKPSIAELKKTPHIDVTQKGIDRLKIRLHANSIEHLVAIAATYLYRTPQNEPEST